MKRKLNTEETKNDNNEITSQVFPIEIADSMDKTIFFSVSEAKKRTSTIHKKRLEVEMLPIYNTINEAINNGKYSIENVKMTVSQKAFLVNKNFGVYYQKSDTSGNDYYKISWC